MLSQEHPRERYSAFGPSSFGEVELLGLVLGCGSAGRSARQIAVDLLDRFGGIRGIAEAPTQALTGVVGIGGARAVRVHAACALARRVASSTAAAEGALINSPQAAWRCLAPALTELDHEELHALYLDRRGRLLLHRRLSSGNDAFTIVDPRQIFRPAVACGGSRVVLAHNHPSGDPRPSTQDIAATHAVAAAGAILGIGLVDHIVVGRGGWVSLAEQGELATWEEGAPLITQLSG